jgi:hypothetical protein
LHFAGKERGADDLVIAGQRGFLELFRVTREASDLHRTVREHDLHVNEAAAVADRLSHAPRGRRDIISIRRVDQPAELLARRTLDKILGLSVDLSAFADRELDADQATLDQAGQEVGPETPGSRPRRRRSRNLAPTRLVDATSTIRILKAHLPATTTGSGPALLSDRI